MEKDMSHIKNGKYELPNGNIEWYKNNKLHREDGPAIEMINGSKEWFYNGQLHRLDGPAVEQNDGGKQWHVYGKLHRLDGPAVIFKNGNQEWWINNIQLSEEFYKEIMMKKNLNDKLKNNLNERHNEKKVKI